MPRETWTNLPADKRQRITDASLAEFGRHGFSSGSLNVIAREAGIAKGSLFQYFEDKLDLFATVSALAAAEIEAATLGAIDRSLPFFDVIEAVAISWVAYYRTHPTHQRFSFAAAGELDAEARAAVRSVTNKAYATALAPLVRRAVKAGELRPDARPEVVLSMVAVVLRHVNSAPFDPVADPAIRFEDLSERRTDALIREYVDALRRAFTA